MISKRADGPPTLSALGLRKWRLSALVVVIVVIASALGSTVLLGFLVGWSSQSLRLELVKVGLTIGAGSGAIFTLLYGIRRQMLSEEVAADNRYDATEKRITELYVKGIEQISSANPTTQFGGLYALERLASDAISLRPVVIDVACAILRQAAEEQDSTFRAAVEALLRDHLAHRSRFHMLGDYWDNVPLVLLNGATLGTGFTRAWKVDTLHAAGANFPSGAHFEDSEIRGANFTGIVVTGEARYDSARLGKGIFANAKFSGPASFRDVRFSLDAVFEGAEFSVDPDFAGAAVGPGVRAVSLPSGWTKGASGKDGWCPIMPTSVGGSAAT